MSPYSQLLGRFPYRGAPARPEVALTFDDGPNEPYTSEIADYLDERGIQATFFQVGKAAARHPEVTRRLIDRGHVIGHHGQSHQFTRYLRRATLSKDIRDADLVFAELGIRPALYRPPWLLRIPALFPVLRRHGMQAVSGEFCHPLEVLQPNPERLARATVAKVRPGSIVIFHDGFDGHEGYRASTVAAVKLVVDRLSADGYSFTTVDRLLEIPAYRGGGVAHHG
jgi:peptidoglycan/xylan/chitin deacetylase (PgdA/CDA1 family)